MTFVFSNKVFGGFIDSSFGRDTEAPTCGYMSTTRGEDYFGGCTQEQYNDCIDGSLLNAIYTRIIDAFGRKTACIQQCSDNNIVEFAGQLTNEDVVVKLTGCSEHITVVNNNGSTTYTFTENGDFTFVFVDDAGNTGYTPVHINGINRIDPECEVSYSQETLTSGDVIATLTGCNKELDGVQMSYTFTGNGNYTFNLVDKFGNTGYTKATVNWIDKEKPVCTVEYSTQQNTTGEVVAILTGCNEEIINSETMYIFEENGSHTFVYRDLVGNINQEIATVDYIQPDDAITGLNHTIEDGNITLTWSGIYDGNLEFYLWNENSGLYQKLGDANIEDNSFIFPIQREGGHLIKIIPSNGGKDIYYSIEYLNIKPIVTLKCEIEYNPDNTKMTNQNVIAKLVNCNGKVEVTNNNLNKIYTFWENGSFTFEFKDENNNTGELSAYVDWIDKIPPECEIKYSTKEVSNGPVIAEVDTENCTKTIDINSYDLTYTFYENGTHLFYFADLVGNIGTAEAMVNWIETNSSQSGNSQGSNPVLPLTCNIFYSTQNPTSGNVIASLTGCNREIVTDITSHIFEQNDIYTFNFTDGSGNPGQAIANVTWIDKVAPVCTINYSTQKATNQNVNATISCDDPNIIIKNNNSQSTYVFTGNSEFVFEVSDTVGNTVSVPAKVSQIDKEVPTCEINYSTIQQTSGIVFATLKNCSEQIFAIPGYNLYHKFSSNGYHTIIFADAVGNIGETRAEVTRIVQDNNENNAPEESGQTITYEYPITGVNHSFYGDTVILAWTALSSGDMDIIVSGSDIYFTKRIHTNDMFFMLSPVTDYSIKFRALDTVQKDVDYIIQKPISPDRPDDPINPDNPDTPDNPINPDDPIGPTDDKAPTCDIVYSTTQKTNEYVIASLYGCSEEIVPLEGFYNSHIFYDNGNYLFYFMDNDGNIGTAWASVDWIVDNIEQNYTLTGISHSISGSTLSITWTPLADGTVEIYLWKPYSKEFEKIGSTNLENRKFLTDITWTGEYLFKLVPVNGDAITYFIFIDNYLGNNDTPICKIKYDYINNSVVASLTGCNKDISITNNNGKWTHIFDNGENMFTFEFKDNVGNIGRTSAYIWYSENFDNYEKNFLSSHLGIGNPSLNSNNQYLVIHSNTPFIGSFTVTGNNILLDNGAILECNVTCVLSSGNNLTINIDGLGSKSISDIIVPGNFAGFISHQLPVSFYTNKLFINFNLDIKQGPEGSCLIDNLSIVSKPNYVISTKKTGAKTGTYYKSQEIEISGLPENTAIPIFTNIDYTDTTIQGYGNCVNNNLSNINYCGGKYITDIILYKNGKVVAGGETVGQNGDIFQIKMKSSIYEDSNITANLMFGHTNKSIISQFSVSTMTEPQIHGSADFAYDYSSFDPEYEFEWNQAYQYSYFYGITTKSTIKDADMYGNLTRIAMAKMLSKYAINVLGLNVDNNKNCSFNDVTWSENRAYDDGVTNACKLGIMGINMPENNFRPYDLVTRSEFATAISRLLYNTEDGKVLYYSTHIDKLRDKKIIKDTNPDLIEKKGYVMLILKRAKDAVN